MGTNSTNVDNAACLANMVGGTLRGCDKENISLPSRVPGTNISYKSEGTQNFHSQMAVTMGKQFKGKMDRTFRLISDETLWMENKHCELNYYVIQFLTDHECFRKYLHRFAHITCLRRWEGRCGEKITSLQREQR